MAAATASPAATSGAADTARSFGSSGGGGGAGWLDGFSVNGGGKGKGGEDGDIDTAGTPRAAAAGGGGGGGGAGAGGGYGFVDEDDGVEPGARRCRRSASIGEEEDDELDSPRPPSKRYRNSLTKTRIACFPLIQVWGGSGCGGERGILPAVIAGRCFRLLVFTAFGS